MNIYPAHYSRTQTYTPQSMEDKKQVKIKKLKIKSSNAKELTSKSYLTE